MTSYAGRLPEALGGVLLTKFGHPLVGNNTEKVISTQKVFRLFFKWEVSWQRP